MKFENLYIECENLEQRDEVFSVCLENGLKPYNCANKYQSVRVSDGVFFSINWEPDAKAIKMNYPQFAFKYGKSEMKKSIEKAMAELKLNRHELSSALGMSRPYIAKMLTCPQSGKTQTKVIKMIDELIKNKNMKSMSCLEITGVSVDCEKIQEQQKTIKELNQALEYKDQLLAKNEDEFQKKSKELRECKCDILELSKTVAGYQDENSELSLKISAQQKSIEDKSSELLDCKMDNSNIRTELKALKRENKDLQVHHAIVCVILIILVAWGFYV